MKTLSAAAAIALALTAGSALAADLPSKKGPPVYVAPAPVFTWTGLYAGINVGYGWNERNSNVSGVLGGGQIGYNYQFAGTGFVGGLEADIQAADLTGAVSGFGLLPVLTARQTLDWFGTVRGRIGYSILPNLLVYGTGGFAYGEGSSRLAYFDNAGLFSQNSETSTRTGWTAGGGVEWAFWPNWSAKVEYLYVDLERGQNLGGFAVNQRGVENRFHTVKVGLNYHVDLFGAPAPVVAKY